MTNLWNDDRKSVVQIENSNAIRICVRNPLILSFHNSLDSLSLAIAFFKLVLVSRSIWYVRHNFMLGKVCVLINFTHSVCGVRLIKETITCASPWWDRYQRDLLSSLRGLAPKPVSNVQVLTCMYAWHVRITGYNTESLTSVSEECQPLINLKNQSVYRVHYV